MAYAPLSYDPWEMPPEERKARLVGREILLQEILSAIAEQQEHQTLQHYLLQGPRGIGKTTLLLALRDRVRETPSLSARWFCVQLREEEYFIRTLRDLLDLVLQGLAEDENLPDAAELAARVHAEQNQERSLAIAVDGLRALAATHGRRILLLIDNFDRVFPATATGRRKARAPESEFRGFRKLLSTESFLMVVAASVRLFEEIAAYDQAFFNFFCPVEIPNLTEEEICELLRRCAEREGNTPFLQQFDAVRAKIRAITYMTGGNPRLVLMLYDVLRHRELMPVVQALRETVGGLTPLLKHVLDDMPRQQSKTLDALVRLRGAASPNDIAGLARLPLNVVTTQLGRLKEGRFVVVEGGGKGKSATYRVADPMFHTWYQMRYLRPAGRRIELFVEFIRAWFSVEERRRFLEEQWGDLGAHRGVSEASLAIQYYAAALEDEGERQKHMGRLADVLAEAGRNREAAMLLADSAEPIALTGRRYESAGYQLLGDRMLERGSLADAEEAFREAVKKDPRNPKAALGLGLCFGLEAKTSCALAEFDRVVGISGIGPNVLATALYNRGVGKEALGDRQGAIADYTAVIDLPGAPVDGIAVALYSRGLTRGTLGDSHGEIGDYTAVVDLPGAPVDTVAGALRNRGVAKAELGDRQGAIGDYTAVVNLPGAPTDQLAVALVNRGVVKRALGDSQGAVSDYTSVVNLPGAPTDQLAAAIVNRGVAKGALGDNQGAIADHTAVLELAGAPIDKTAAALYNRGVAKVSLGDIQGAIADYTAVVELPSAPAHWIAAALLNRGAAFGARGDHHQALSDFASAVDLPEIPADGRSRALVGLGLAMTELGRTEEAVRPLEECLALRASAVSVHMAFFCLTRLYLQGGRFEEAMRSMARLHQLEPEDTAIERRLEARINVIVAAARDQTPETATSLLNALLEGDPEDVRARMAFLGPALEYAETRNEQVLSGLPDRERDAAKQIAAAIRGMGGGVSPN